MQEGIYHVEFILDKTTFTVYIGKTNEEILSDTPIDLQKQLSITHFNFGVDKKKRSTTTDEHHVTLTTVLLYNRSFNEGEINKSKSNLTTTAHNGKTTQGNTEKDGAEIKLCLRSMNTITVLLSLFFGVFTLLGRYVY